MLFLLNLVKKADIFIHIDVRIVDCQLFFILRTPTVSILSRYSHQKKEASI